MGQEKEKILENMISKLSRDIKLIFISLATSNLVSPETSLKKNLYTEKHFLKDLGLYLPQKFPKLKDKKIENLWGQFKKIIQEKGNCDIFKEFPKHWYKVYTLHYSLILKEIRDQVNDLNPKEKIGIYVFLKNKELFKFNLTREDLYAKLNKIYFDIFKEPIIHNVGEILIKTGILFESSYINTQGSPTGFMYQVANYLMELDQIIMSEVRNDKDLVGYIKKIEEFQNVPKTSEEKLNEKFCPLCGKSNLPNAKYCSECGSEI